MTSSLQLRSGSQLEETSETASTPTINSVPGDGEENPNIVPVIVIIAAVIALLLLLMVLVVIGILILKAKRRKSFMQTCASEHDLQTSYERGMPVCMCLHTIHRKIFTLPQILVRKISCYTIYVLSNSMQECLLLTIHEKNIL